MTGLLALFIVVAFFGVLHHLNQMVFGKPTVSLKVQLPASCLVALVITMVPVVVLGVYLPEPAYQLLQLAASSLGR